jgi:hypothetical protein
VSSECEHAAGQHNPTQPLAGTSTSVALPDLQMDEALDGPGRHKGFHPVPRLGSVPCLCCGRMCAPASSLPIHPHVMGLIRSRIAQASQTLACIIIPGQYSKKTAETLSNTSVDDYPYRYSVDRRTGRGRWRIVLLQQVFVELDG